MKNAEGASLTTLSARTTNHMLPVLDWMIYTAEYYRSSARCHVGQMYPVALGAWPTPGKSFLLLFLHSLYSGIAVRPELPRKGEPHSRVRDALLSKKTESLHIALFQPTLFYLKTTWQKHFLRSPQLRKWSSAGLDR